MSRKVSYSKIISFFLVVLMIFSIILLSQSPIFGREEGTRNVVHIEEIEDAVVNSTYNSRLPALPQSVLVTFDDGLEKYVPVTWDTMNYFGNVTGAHTIYGDLDLSGEEGNPNNLVAKVDVLVVEKIFYDIIEGKDQSTTKESGEDIIFIVEADFDKFTGVYINDSYVAPINYSAEETQEGYVNITVKSRYVDIMPSGTHIVSGIFTDGEGNINLTVSGTKVSTSVGVGILIGVIIIMVIVVNFYKKKNKE